MDATKEHLEKSIEIDLYRQELLKKTRDRVLEDFELYRKNFLYECDNNNMCERLKGIYYEILCNIRKKEYEIYEDYEMKNKELISKIEFQQEQINQLLKNEKEIYEN